MTIGFIVAVSDLAQSINSVFRVLTIMMQISHFTVALVFVWLNVVLVNQRTIELITNRTCIKNI